MRGSKESNTISVIVPVYNVEKFLDECIESVCNQTYKNLQIILVDDGSTDGSGNICDKWAKEDDRIIAIHKENGGISSARNKGIEIAEGEYIGFIDSDDVIEPEFYSELYNLIKEKDTSVVGCDYKIIDENSELMPEEEKLSDEISYTPEQYIMSLCGNIRMRTVLVIAMNKLYKKSIFSNIKYREGIVHEDEEIMPKIVFEAGTVFFTPKQLYCYRKRKNSIMHENFSKKRLVLFNVLSDRVKFAKEKNLSDECIEMVARECVNCGVRFWMLVNYKKDIVSKEENKKFYLEVKEAVKEYKKFGTKKQKLLWFMFEKCPKLLGAVYYLFKKLKGSKR